MIRTRITFNGDPAMREIRARSWNGLRRATLFFWQQLQLALNIPNPGVRVRRGRRTRTIYPSPSQPGEPPRKRTGFGQRNVIYRLDQTRMMSKVGIMGNAPYMAYLELGTRRVRARPWLLATLMRFRAQIKTLLES